MKRKASITRKTKETKIDVELNIDGKGQYKICLLYTSDAADDC